MANYPALDSTFVGAFHNGGNTNAYNEWVLEWLDPATDYGSAVSKLNDLRGWLLSGCLVPATAPPAEPFRAP